MTTRTLNAEHTGPVTLDLDLPAGSITVRAEAGRERAELTIRTADETGPSADAVTAAVLRWETRGAMVAQVNNTGGTGFTSVVRGNRGTTVVQSFGNVPAGASIVGLQIDGDLSFVGGRMIVNGQVINAGSGSTVRIGDSPIEIIAAVPEGSTVIARTRSADVTADGAFAAVNGRTQSGDVRLGTVERTVVETQSGDVIIYRSQDANIRTQSGDVRLGRTDLVQANTQSGDISVADFGGTAHLKTMSGDVNVHATAGGNLTVRTMSGDIGVTATDAALGDDLDVQANSMSGRVRTPQRQAAGSTPRRRRD
ncbi:DUF4097 family beta strand repeat-containing protein [Kitasatospora cathayae]|uniref:DUF4097 family beta strand repeat-containing protein n=1 Tax=Kitasatospora cathayae TaxID=3004092 RepID=A0ABY7QIW8_9ACTN|nr:DUF4097 family beta strand repeat-containing protein [Kitasatospora sp. HUAS 3-15]WBP92194.1 DUF4097 family beta strand repeat-containing protein [Kitasatospora sp. HUAS 3-15]